ncbi:Polynucleotide adenylyltransferase region [Coraliomargarita akajimensis DSM 45221]|uniref:Polynucleotide adenylyltransferase region n=2 Tax=Coraliomargarita TaxID=442430 RepID=D5EPJ9_CORAD|nr:Polynucleotide adenylyltransferase region [Coraliomargarita akajimensis DSM 45221]
MQAAGGRALLVGGCVRDGMLGIATKDVDVEVYGLSVDTVEAELAKEFRLDTVGRSFGVFILKGLEMDIALPRSESRTGPKHTDFEVKGDPAMTPQEAAARRDFTINAICYDPLNDELIDSYNGQADLLAKRLRHVSDAFIEDPLRVLRGMQFIARFDLEADPETVDLCRQLNPEHLPEERLWEEWKKLILKGTQLSKGLNFLKDCGWLPYFPELEALVGCEQDPTWHPEGDVWTHTGHCLDAYAANRIGDEWEDLIVGFAVLCHDFGKPDTSYFDAQSKRIRSPRHDVLGVPVAERFLARMTRHKKVFEEVLPLVEQHMRPLALFRDGAGDAAIRRLAARVKRLDRLCRVAYADKSGRPPIIVENFEEGDWLLERAAALAIKDNAPKPLMLGRHLVELGIKPGPHFGKILDRAYEAQLDGVFDELDGGVAFLRKTAIEMDLLSMD